MPWVDRCKVAHHKIDHVPRSYRALITRPSSHHMITQVITGFYMLGQMHSNTQSMQWQGMQHLSFCPSPYCSAWSGRLRAVSGASDRTSHSTLSQLLLLLLPLIRRLLVTRYAWIAPWLFLLAHSRLLQQGACCGSCLILAFTSVVHADRSCCSP